MQTDELGASLLRALAAVPDPRSPHGRRHPLPAVLALATAAMRCGARSLYAIAQWGREQPEGVVRTPGVTRRQTPGVATLHRVFNALDVEAFEAALAKWAQAAVGGRGRGEAIALDGNALRGIHGEQLPGVRLVAAYDVRTGLVLAQGGVRQTSVPTALAADASEDELAAEKARAELSVAPALLRMVPLAGRVVTGDALYCQRTLCAQIRQAQGHYLFVIKRNQPELLEDVALLFDQPPRGEAFATASRRRTQRERHEVRTLSASAALADYLGGLSWRTILADYLGGLSWRTIWWRGAGWARSRSCGWRAA